MVVWLGIVATTALEEKQLLTIQNMTQLKIIEILDREQPLTSKEITYRSKFKYKRIYKELQKLVEQGILIKDKHKLYSINAEYGEFLIEYGMKIKGVKKPPKAVIFIKKFDELKEIVEYLIELMREGSDK